MFRNKNFFCLEHDEVTQPLLALEHLLHRQSGLLRNLKKPTKNIAIATPYQVQISTNAPS